MNPQDNQQPQGPPNQPAVQPEVYNSPSLNNMPYGGQPAPGPQPPNGQVPQVVSPQIVGAINDPAGSEGGSRKKWIIIGAALGLVIILLIIAVVIAGGGNSGKKADDTTQQTSTDKLELVEPAKALETEQINNSINQDLSSLDDEKDLPNNSLESQTLGL